MKVLMIHNGYRITGGEDVSTNAEYLLLKSHGVDIDTFFINNDTIGNTNKFKLAYNTIWSNRYYREIFNRINTGKYDIVHIQNFFPLFSPSIFYAAKKAGAKVVMTVRNYRLICPNGLMYVNGAICTKCIGKTVPYPALQGKCYRDSLSTSAVTVAMLSLHNFLNTWKNQVDGFICVSTFVREQLIKGGIDEEALHVKHNFVFAEIPPNFEPEDYYIYAGRISAEKGIDILLNTFRRNKKKILIIGDGPQKWAVQDAAEKHPTILYLGKLPLRETYQKIAKAKALIFPSKWHEPFGRTIAEAFAHGTPVIGSALGGISELIQNGHNGILFNPGTEDGLSMAVTQFEEMKDFAELRKNAYQSYQKHYSPDYNLIQLIKIY